MRLLRASLAALALSAAAPAIAVADNGSHFAYYEATGARPCGPDVAAYLNGSWQFSTRTMNFTVDLKVDSACNVAGATQYYDGWTPGGTFIGRVVGRTIVVTAMRSAKGRNGAGYFALVEGKDGISLQGDFSEDGGTYPTLGLYGTKLPYKPVTSLGVKRSPTALNDVDVYSGPGGKYKVIGMMRKGAVAAKLDYNADGWCRLQGVAGGADGWVAVDHLTGC